MNEPFNYNEMPSPEEPEPIVGGKTNRSHEGWRSIASTIFIIIATPLLALFLINFVFQSYEVDGPSMETTLQNADRLIVWKAPKTIANITGKDYIPNRCDIIIFHTGGGLEAGGDRQLIKRAVGLPGDRVVVKDGKVTVYNDENTEGFNPDEFCNNNSEFSKVTESNGPFTDYTVNEGEVYAMGDNRGNSLDSRIFGAVPSDMIVGKLEFRIYPFNKFEHF